MFISFEMLYRPTGNLLAFLILFAKNLQAEFQYFPVHASSGGFYRVEVIFVNLAVNHATLVNVAGFRLALLINRKKKRNNRKL